MNAPFAAGPLTVVHRHLPVRLYAGSLASSQSAPMRPLPVAARPHLAQGALIPTLDLIRQMYARAISEDKDVQCRHRSFHRPSQALWAAILNHLRSSPFPRRLIPSMNRQRHSKIQAVWATESRPPDSKLHCKGNVFNVSNWFQTSSNHHHIVVTPECSRHFPRCGAFLTYTLSAGELLRTRDLAPLFIIEYGILSTRVIIFVRDVRESKEIDSRTLSRIIEILEMTRFGAVVLILVLVLAASVRDAVSAGPLTSNFYQKTCPKAEEIIRQTVYQLYEKKGNIATSLIRFSFHDFFNGADGSFLLLSTPGKTSEKDSFSQEGMRNEKYVNNLKDAVEKVCPGIVSCADVLAVGGAAAVQVLGGQYVKVLLGRRDSRVSLKSSADTIPHPQDTVDKVLAFYNASGITTEQAVALMGAHTIGRAHCVSFKERLYPTVDANLDPAFAQMLLHRCPANPTEVHFTYFRNDDQSPMAFDNHYYVDLLAKRGLMGIDSKLSMDPRTRPFVVKFAADAAYWRSQFAAAFVQLSEFKPLTGTLGEIRKRCSYVN